MIIDSIDWLVIYPEVILAVMACVIALVDLGVKHPQRGTTYWLTLLTLAMVAVVQMGNAQSGRAFYAWGGMVVQDAMGSWLKCFASVAMMVTLVYGRSYAAQRAMLERGGELFVLALLALLGMFVMISASNFLLIYLGLELLTLSSYALVALRRDHAGAIEAAMKYFVLGALASGFLLYGLSMLYGATGSLDLSRVLAAVESGVPRQQVLVFGLVFVVAGLAFKLGVVPFHMWVPDVYQGAPTAITALIGGAPKLAAFAIAMRLLVEGLLPLAVDWQQMLAFLAIASLLIGNLAGLQQSNLKRMLAYSTISQMGFVLLGLMSGVIDARAHGATAANAYSAAMFYIVSYVLTALAAFGVIQLLARTGFESEEISDFAGLNQRSPLYAAVMGLCLLSMAGIPPLVGFYAKLAVLQALLASGGALAVALAVFAVMMSLIGAFYYLRVIKVMYFDQAAQPSAPVSATWDVHVVLAVNGALVLLLGIAPGGLMALCGDAIARTLAF